MQKCEKHQNLTFELHTTFFLQMGKKNLTSKNSIQKIEDDTFAKKLRVFPSRVQKSFLNM